MTGEKASSESSEPLEREDRENQEDREARVLQRSQHVDRFNHDEDAAGYDADVANESDPIRAGYGELLAWVAEHAEAACAAASGAARILEIGSGTGNLTLRLPTSAQQILCVDISTEMTALARRKLRTRREVEFVHADALEAMALPAVRAAQFDAIVSTYTLHHLTEPEKRSFTGQALERLAPGGRLIVGDLMFEDRAQEEQLLAALRRSGHSATADEIEEEFFWRLDAALPQLQRFAGQLEVKRFSDLSWGFACARQSAEPAAQRASAQPQTP